MISNFLADLAGVFPDLPALDGVGLAGALVVWVETGFGVEFCTTFFKEWRVDDLCFTCGAVSIDSSFEIFYLLAGCCLISLCTARLERFCPTKGLVLYFLVSDGFSAWFVLRSC